MREIETKRACVVLVCKSGLAVVAVGKVHFFRASRQIAGQEDAHGSTGDGEVPTIVLEIKTLGPSPFVIRQDFVQARQQRIADFQGDAPDVYVVCRQRRRMRGRLPFGVRSQDSLLRTWFTCALGLTRYRG